MKKIIEGKLYNTETAELIGWFSTGGYSLSDGHYISQDIYRSKGGQYFLYIVGGGLTEYAIRSNGTLSGSEDIKLIDEKEIADWLEKYSVHLSEETVNKFLSVIPFPEG